MIAVLEDKTTVKGEADPQSFVPGVVYRFWGKWGKKSAKYGQAFEFKQYQQQEPHSRHGVVQYLLKYAAGIGSVYASQLWDAFGVEAVKTLRCNVDAVAAACPQIPRLKLADASASLQQYAATEDIRIELTQLLDGRGFSHKLIDMCIKRWGLHAASRIRHDPFTLLVNKLPTCGFARCDRLWSDLGLPPDRLKRQLMCLWKDLQENSDGNTWRSAAYARDVILHQISGVPGDRVDWRRAIKLGLRSRWLESRCDAAGQYWIAIGQNTRAERELAERLVDICNAEPSHARLQWPDPDKIAGLTQHQRDTLKKCFSGGRLAILGGTPGTGKTTTSGAVLRELTKAVGSSNIVACTPTGKASVRLRVSLERAGVTGIEPATIHRTLGTQRNGHDGEGWDFWFNRDRQMPYMVYLLDEASMPDVTLCNHLFQAIPDGSLVLIVGDPYQLPPVEHGTVLRDAIAAGLPYGELSEVLRNNGDAVQACSAIKDGRRFLPSAKIDIAAGQNFLHVEARAAEFAWATLRRTIIQAPRFELPGGKAIDPVWDIQVITALNEHGPVSRKLLNDQIREVMNPNGTEAAGNPFRVGDKVICKDNCTLRVIDRDQAGVVLGDANDADDGDDEGDDSRQDGDFVAKGEIGQVLAVSSDHMAVWIDSPERCVYVPRRKDDSNKQGGCIANFDLGYAITFHRSQGSQWPIVILMADRSANRLACRELWYTGISRMESLVITIGERDVIYRQCQRVALKDRKTFLAELIKERADSYVPFK